MKTWTADIDINTTIDNVWEIIDGSEENLQKLDPKILSNKVIEETEGRIGSKYLQQYQEGKKVMEYVVEVLDYYENNDNKMFKIGFSIGGWFDITVEYILTKIADNKTHLAYTTTNKPLKWFAKIMMKMMGNNTSVVDKHVEKIKELAESM